MVDFKIEKGKSDQITYSGKRIRRDTVLLKMGNVSVSRKAFVLGSLLIICQIFDGLLTYIGLSMMGIHMEGNAFLRSLMHSYGSAPVLFGTKIIAIVLIALLTFEAHRRQWIRPIIALLILVYLALAVIPWTYLISKQVARTSNGQPQ